MGSSKEQVAVIVSGVVQGVGFRMFVYRKALETGVTGWVRNNSDGTVAALFQGNHLQLTKILFYCQMGPPAASVTEVTSEHTPITEQFMHFSLLT